MWAINEIEAIAKQIGLHTEKVVEAERKQTKKKLKIIEELANIYKNALAYDCLSPASRESWNYYQPTIIGKEQEFIEVQEDSDLARHYKSLLQSYKKTV